MDWYVIHNTDYEIILSSLYSCTYCRSFHLIVFLFDKWKKNVSARQREYQKLT
jgi:hypothetical protein